MWSHVPGLEAMRLHEVPEIVFTSTSTVYGEAWVIPTPKTIPARTYLGLWCKQAGMRGAHLSILPFVRYESWNFRFAISSGSGAVTGDH